MSKKTEKTVVKEALSFQQVHLMLSLLDREIQQYHMKKIWYPRQADGSYYAMCMNSGIMMARVVHPDAIDKFIQMFPNLYYFFEGYDQDTAMVYSRKLADQYDEAFKEDTLIKADQLHDAPAKVEPILKDGDDYEIQK
jgi:hypothetical protein